ncbi:MAG: metalloregulator ArsR/SmtB family transcription factor [Anaerolineaceae bacterium]|nr:metalloregulator ArsR/SmtB family transcription factor [Anaerolineaceae bacterium]
MITINDQKLLHSQLKAVADNSRLGILRLLYKKEYSVGELANAAALSEPTVSHHLARLREAGLVSLRMAGNQRFYKLNPAGLTRFKKMVEEIEVSPPLLYPGISDDRWIEALGWETYDQKVLKEHTHNGKITSLPSKLKKTLVILRWLATLFQPDRIYSETEINEVLKEKYEWDYVSLRRDLISTGYLKRESGGGKYWLNPDVE